MTERICMFCTHLSYEKASYGDYSDPAALECCMGHFPSGREDGKNVQSRAVYDVEDFRRLIIQAETCPDYDQVKV